MRNPLLDRDPAEVALEACRHGRYATYDPVLRCALDADSDDAAKACVDRIVRDVTGTVTANRPDR